MHLDKRKREQERVEKRKKGKRERMKRRPQSLLRCSVFQEFQKCKVIDAEICAPEKKERKNGPTLRGKMKD